VALAAVAVLACGSHVALGDPSDTILSVTVLKPGGQQPPPESITSGSLQSRPQQCPPYAGGTMREFGIGGTPEPQTFGSTAWSVATILECLQPAIDPPDASGGITVFRADGSPQTGDGSTLSVGDLRPPTNFNDPNESPVISDLGTSRRYDRPWRGGDDENFLDQITVGGPIAIEVFEGQQLPVTVTPQSATVAQGGTVPFSASVQGGASGLAYQWSFGGGAPNSSLQNPQVTFDTGGTWTVSLLVTDTDGDDGHAQTTVRVTAPGPTTSTTPTAPGTVTTGPSKSTGTTPRGTSGPKGGGKGSPTGKPTHQPSTKTHGSPSTNNHTHTTTTQTSTTQTSTTPSGGSGSGSGGGGSSGSGASGAGSGSSGSTGGGAPGAATTPSSKPTTPHTPKAPTHRRTSPPASGAPQLVTGQLISDVVPVPESASPLVHAVATQATPATAPALHPPAAPSPWPIIGSALAIAALLGAGAWRELRAPGRRLPRWLPVHARA
jgi:PKD repeat protein